MQRSIMSIALKMISDKVDATPIKRRRERTKEKEAFAGDSAQTPPATQQSPGIGANHRILVVDDNPVVLKAFELKLKSLGFAVSVTANAPTVASTVESEKSELILLDINFPSGGAMDWNGFTILQWLRRFPELARVPVIFITGSDAAKYREQALAAGAAGFFQKPVDFEQLLKRMLELLGEPQSSNGSPPQDDRGRSN